MSRVKDYEGVWATRFIDGVSIYEKALELEKKLEEAKILLKESQIGNSNLISDTWDKVNSFLNESEFKDD